MTPQELADEIMPQVEEAYKETVLWSALKDVPGDFGERSMLYKQSRLGEIRVIIPIPEDLMRGVTITALAEIVAQRDFVSKAGEFEENVLFDADGEPILNCLQQDMVGLEIFCKPLRDVRLA
jgi:hypothetical protein